MRVYCGKIDCCAVHQISNDFVSAFTRFGRAIIILAASLVVARVIVALMFMP